MNILPCICTYYDSTLPTPTIRGILSCIHPVNLVVQFPNILPDWNLEWGFHFPKNPSNNLELGVRQGFRIGPPPSLNWRQSNPEKNTGKSKISLIHSEIYRHENSSARNVQLDIRVNKTLENTEKLKNSMIDKDFNNRKKQPPKPRSCQKL